MRLAGANNPGREGTEEVRPKQLLRWVAQKKQLFHRPSEQTLESYLSAPKAIDGACRAVSQFDVKHREVPAARPAGQPVGARLPQRRHPARKIRPAAPQIPHEAT